MRILRISWVILAVFPLRGELDSVWTRVIKPGSNHYRAMSVAVDSENNYIMAGYGTTPDEMWVFKLSQDGDTLWSFHAPSECATDISVNTDGNYIVAGINRNTLTIRKLDRDTGNQIWMMSYTGYLSPPEIAVDRSGFVVVASTRPQGSLVSIEIMKVSSDNGHTLWTRRVSQVSNINFQVAELLVDRDGNYLLSADSIYKIDASDGSVQWTLNFSGAQIAIDRQGFYIIAENTPDGQICLVKIDPATLSTVWRVTQPFNHFYGQGDYFDLFSVITDTNNYYVVAGSISPGYFYPAIAVFSPLKGDCVYQFERSDMTGKFFSLKMDTTGQYIAVGEQIDSSAFFIEKFTPVDREIMWFDTVRAMHTDRQKIFAGTDGSYLLPFDSLNVIGVTVIDSALGQVIATVAGTVSFSNPLDAIIDGNGYLVYLGSDTLQTLAKLNINTGEVVEFHYRMSDVHFKRVVSLPGGDYLVAADLWNNSYGPFVARLDGETGEVLWWRSDYVASYPHVNTMTVDNQGDVIIGVSLSPDTVCVLKISPGSGDVLWSDVFTGYDSIIHISVDRVGNYLISLSSFDSSGVLRVNRDSGTPFWQTTLSAHDLFVKDDPNTDYMVAMGPYIQLRLDISTGDLIFSKYYDYHSYHGPHHNWYVKAFDIDAAGHYLVRSYQIFTKLYGSSVTYISAGEDQSSGEDKHIGSLLSTGGLKLNLRFERPQMIDVSVYRSDGRRIIKVKRRVNRGVNSLSFPLKTGVYFVEISTGEVVRGIKCIVVR